MKIYFPSIFKTDSTYVALATKLFANGMEGGDNNKRFVKYSVNLKGSLPSSVEVFTHKRYASEDIALSELINDSNGIEGNIVVFDRGIQARKSFEKFTDNGKWFITRSRVGIRCWAEKAKDIGEKPAASTVTVISDQIGKLTDKEHTTLPNTITASSKQPSTQAANKYALYPICWTKMLI